MSWINQLFDWSNQGTDPSDSLKESGFKGGMRPPASVFNAFWYKTIKAIKELQDNVEKGANKTVAGTASPKANGTAAVGTSAKYAREDHVHPLQTTVSGNAGSATKLQTARTIDGVSFDGSAAITHYGTCSTAAATAAKVVSLTGFTLATGARIAVKFTVTNTAANPTLNVNGTGAKAIYYRGAAISADYLASGRTYEFIYNGTQYDLVGDINTDAKTTVDSALSSTSTNPVQNKVINSALEGKAASSHTHDDRYYTESEVDTKLSGKANSSHSHDAATTSANGFMSSTDKAKLDGIASGANATAVDSALSSTSTNPVQNKVINSALSGKANSSHTHDDRYYTESEVDTKLSGKANSSHTHSDYLPKSGGTMTGALTLSGAPTADLQAATKKYVDGLAPLIINASSITSAETMNAAIESINNAYKNREVLLYDDGIFHLLHAAEEMTIFGYARFDKIITATLIRDIDTISYDSSYVSATQRTVTLSASGWTASGDVYTQTATVSGVSATETSQEIHVTPATASMSAYMESGVYASAQAANKITFTASKAPTAALTVYVVIRPL